MTLPSGSLKCATLEPHPAISTGLFMNSIPLSDSFLKVLSTSSTWRIMTDFSRQLTGVCFSEFPRAFAIKSDLSFAPQNTVGYVLAASGHPGLFQQYCNDMGVSINRSLHEIWRCGNRSLHGAYRQGRNHRRRRRGAAIGLLPLPAGQTVIASRIDFSQALLTSPK